MTGIVPNANHRQNKDDQAYLRSENERQEKNQWQEEKQGKGVQQTDFCSDVCLCLRIHQGIARAAMGPGVKGDPTVGASAKTGFVKPEIHIDDIVHALSPQIPVISGLAVKSPRA